MLWWGRVGVGIVVGVWFLALPHSSHALTLDGYFKLLAMVAKKRDVWRKVFMGNDVGFEMSPWLFDDRVLPPYVPLVNTFPRYPVHGHYRNERVPPQPLLYYPPPVSPVPLLAPPPTDVYHAHLFPDIRRRKQRLWSPKRRALSRLLSHSSRPPRTVRAPPRTVRAPPRTEMAPPRTGRAPSRTEMAPPRTHRDGRREASFH